KRSIADGSVGLPHVRVGHRQALIQSPVSLCWRGFFHCELADELPAAPFRSWCSWLRRSSSYSKPQQGNLLGFFFVCPKQKHRQSAVGQGVPVYEKAPVAYAIGAFLWPGEAALSVRSYRTDNP
ncbi:MAG: hypothetical protein KYX62_10425, partial [Pseudomonadota bacterium]|nr:hypothetical protein [Pseudomonadota bacterium]